MAKANKAANGTAKARTQVRPDAKPSGRATASKSPPAAKHAIRADWATDLVFDVREPKLAVSLRLDADVLRFFRGFGSGYQTRINEVLRAFMQARGSATDPAAHAIPAARLPRASNGSAASKRAR